MKKEESFSERFNMNRKKDLSVAEFIDGILSGNAMALGRAITLVESTNPLHAEMAQAILEKCIPHSGNSVRIGITGVPGVGKSTFIEAFGSYLIEKHQRKVAVLAIDPSSQKSGGSILGDKTRMQELSQNKHAFIRPSPASGTLGGVARATRESIILCEAAGFDTIMVETVGVGQSETTVNSMVDFFLLLMLAGAGDELQGIKRGIMEMADMIVIHKADGENRNNAKLAMRDYKNALHLFPAKNSGWQPAVEMCSSIEGTGLEIAWKQLSAFLELTKTNGFFEKNRKQQSLAWMNQTIESRLKEGFYASEIVKKLLPEFEKEVISGTLNPFQAAEKLIAAYQQGG